MNIVIIIATILISGIIFIPVGVLIRKKAAESKISSAESEAKRLLENANREAENIKKEEIFKAKEEIMRSRDELDKEIRERRGEVQSQERRLIQKEENLEKRSEMFERKERELEKEEKELDQKKDDIQEIFNRQMQELQRISGLSSEEAKKQLLSELEKQLTNEKAILIKEVETKAKEDANKNAKEILSYAIQKCAADHTSETTVSIVNLPNDDMKGRIIGREGRNIKALETLTGIDLIIDDTPDAVIISGFDPLRREVAKLALEKLINDAMIYANDVVYKKAQSKEDLSGMGTTLDICLIYNSRLYIGHIGDSRVYRIRKEFMRKITRDDSYVQTLIEDGTITKEEAFRHPKKNMLTKALGCTKEIEPTVYTKTFIKNDIILMSSDGLTNMVREDEIYKIIKEEDNSHEALIKKANENGGLDNITVIVIYNCVEAQ